jgi:hypothetical protein
MVRKPVKLTVASAPATRSLPAVKTGIRGGIKQKVTENDAEA